MVVEGPSISLHHSFGAFMKFKRCKPHVVAHVSKPRTQKAVAEGSGIRGHCLKTKMKQEARESHRNQSAFPRLGGLATFLA